METVNVALYDVFRKILDDHLVDAPLIYNFENGIRPQAPFLSIDFRSLITEGSKPHYSGVVDGVQTITNSITQATTLYSYGKEAFDYLTLIRNSLQRPVYMDLLREAGLTIPRFHDIVIQPISFRQEYEHQANFDFDLTYLDKNSFEQNWIQHADLERYQGE